MSDTFDRDLEKRVYEIEKKLATLDLISEHSSDRYKELKNDLKDLKVGLNRILWSLGAVALGALGNFIIQGGLNVTP